MKIQDENTIERIKNFLMRERKKYDGQKLWILPHIRGQGILVPQVFEVVKSD